MKKLNLFLFGIIILFNTILRAQTLDTIVMTEDIKVSNLSIISNGIEVTMNWDVFPDSDSEFFIMQKSNNDVNYTDIRGVHLVQAYCKSVPSLSYQLKDTISLGKYYYRLREIDFDGNEYYSRSIPVIANNIELFYFNILPNPNNGNFKSVVSADKGVEIVIVLYTTLGEEVYSKVVVTKKAGNNIYAMDLLDKLPTGIYLITATSNNKILSKRLIVN